MAIEQRQRRLSIWPRYNGAKLGLRNYWYPVMWSRKLGAKPVAIELCGEPIMLVRRNGRPFAFFDQCPHRGIPLSVGREEFPGTWTCRYHGWTFELETGILKAALTDGPDSPICGKVRVKTYPVQERAGLVWVYVGEEPAPPVEDDIPEEFLQPGVVVVGRITTQTGDWRFACENGFDEGHAMYLHRFGSFYTAFRIQPGWRRTDVVSDGDGYISRATQSVGFQGEFPELGTWPAKPPLWQRRGQGHRVSVHLPGFIRVKAAQHRHAYWVWWTPVNDGHYRMLQFYTKPTSGLDALKFRLAYWLYRRPWHHVQFNNQDAWMVRLTPETAPERLYRPDASITAWRKLCEHARGQTSATSLDDDIREVAEEFATV
jgi:phenylpropionate dioxygenase-like ring-hydroxylating dioxygenase large terminal subunit